MEYRLLGQTGLKVAVLGMGCMTLGHGVDESTGHRMLDRYVEAGGNLLDVADNYGAAEEVVGRWLKGSGLRSQIVLATKVRFPVGPGPNDVGLSRKHILDSVENSLRKLQTDYIDLYQAHCWDFVTPVDETLHAFDDLIRAGKVRYIGASNFAGWQIVKALARSDANGWARFISLQIHYNLLVRSAEWEILPACLQEGVGVTAWSPLAAGWLSGKYRRDSPPPGGSRLSDAAQTAEEWQRVLGVSVSATIPHPRKIDEEAYARQREGAEAAERRWRIIEAAGDVARARGKTHSQVALAWILARPGLVGPILGARTPEQLDENLGSVGWVLSEEELGWLNAVSDPGAPYPVDFFNQYGIPWR